MAGKVFISCGQANKYEIKVARQLEEWFKSEGFSLYVAIQTQSIFDVNSGIISNLENSDYYLFLNFRRERISFIRRKYRGSLFTNQELAIAYYLKFDHSIFFEQSGVKREGLINYMIANAKSFKDYTDIVDLVKEAVKLRKWDPDYSRHLKIGNLYWSGELSYRDAYGNQYLGKVLNLQIINQRKDIPSYKTQIRLENIEENGTKRESADKSPIKCEGQPGYKQTIWPDSSGSFSLLIKDKVNPLNLHLLSSMDVFNKPQLISSVGSFKLHFSILAENFPLLRVIVDLNHKGVY